MNSGVLLFLLKGGAKGGGQSVNCLGGCVASRFKTLCVGAGGRFTSLFSNNKLCTHNTRYCNITLSILYSCILCYCNLLPLFLYSGYVCNVCVMGEALLGDMMMI
jgi:hypothetical protein